MSGTEWMMTGVYFAALMVGGTYFMSTLARRTLSKLKEQGR